MSREAIIQEARSWLGTPYHSNAMVKGVGVDCGMLLIAVFSESAGMPRFDPGPYSPEWHMHQGEEKYLNHVEKFFDEIELAQIVPGDILVYRYGRTWSHGTIVVSPTEVVHAYVGLGVILTEIGQYPLTGKSLKAREPRGFRLKGL